MEDVLIIIVYVVIGIIIFKVLKYLLAVIVGLRTPLNVSGKHLLKKLLKENDIDIENISDDFFKEVTENAIGISRMTACLPNKNLNTEFVHTLEVQASMLAHFIKGHMTPDEDDPLYKLLKKYNVEIARGE